MDWINSHLSLNSVIWLFLASFMVHDFEEIIFVESWMSKHYEKVSLVIPKLFRKGFESYRNIKSSQFAAAVAIEFVIFIPTTILAADFHHYLLFIGFNAVLMIHVFTHLFQSLLLRMYTPGVATAVVVVLPYSIYLFYRQNQAGILNWQVFNNGLDVGIILLPLVLFGHSIGRRIIPN
ncbi:HXXEE domain-containing protein [Bacillus sp. BRMEA1]|uniref:HXXEE domain-containing protein n=1 Tax=Neobacillus endophyticus TaxID=2738405 RepID=UPI0015663CB5|nr:HXXEE domain-containing protein [Neobacillus endophyticus]NRD78055.1 HXXEE domain-containing protein [Neobacillus endophyticus]